MTLFSKNACLLLDFDLQEYQGPIAVLENLQPFSSYAIQVAVKNYYSDEEVLPMGEGTVGTTLYGGLFNILPWIWTEFSSQLEEDVCKFGL